MSSSVVRFDAMRSVAFGSITGSFVAVGSSFGHPMRLLKFVNTTNADIIVSFDGTTNNDIIPAGGFSLYDATTNREENVTTFVLANGTQVFAKYVSAPSSGTFYIVCVYGQGE